MATIQVDVYVKDTKYGKTMVIKTSKHSGGCVNCWSSIVQIQEVGCIGIRCWDGSMSSVSLVSYMLLGTRWDFGSIRQKRCVC